jgi:TolB-like protein/DNA-binding winged helix-turn-helix (wHTH) protein/tetratricopeptide (TPR) repeat protein
VLDPESGDVARAGSRIRLQEQPLQVLLELIAAGGGLVTREQLIAKLWPKGVVDFDTGLNTVIRKLRAALEDTADTPRYIETLPRRGYRFIATLDARPELPAPAMSAEPVASAPQPSSISAPETAVTDEIRPVVAPAEMGKAASPSPGLLRSGLLRRVVFVSAAVIGVLTVLVVLHRVHGVDSVRLQQSVVVTTPTRAQSVPPAPFTPPAHSIAVLPFVNMSSDKEQEYFADGLAEELLELLAKTPGLHVIARTSSFSFKGKSDDIPTIAAKLHVANILEGSVRKSGNRLRVSAQLVRAADGQHLWSETYDREMKDIFKLQDEVAAAVVAALKLTLSPGQGSSGGHSANALTVNPDSYEKYLLGRYYWTRGDEQNLKKSVELYRQALATDPQNALAQAGLADAYSSLSDWYMPPRAAIPEAKAAAMSALNLDESLWAAHNALCLILTIYEWNWSAAEGECRRAIKLNPNAADAHDNYGMLLAYVGRAPEAAAELRRAEELDPLSFRIYGDGALAFFLARNYPVGVEQARRSIDLAPDYFVTRGYLALIYVQMGRNGDAVAQAEKGVQLTDSTIMRGFLAYVYAATGQVERAREIADRLIRERTQRYVCGFEIAMTKLSLGETDQAFRWLETAYEDRSLCIPTMKFDPRLDPVRSDQRYLDLIRRVGFPSDPAPSD